MKKLSELETDFIVNGELLVKSIEKGILTNDLRSNFLELIKYLSDEDKGVFIHPNDKIMMAIKLNPIARELFRDWLIDFIDATEEELR